VLLDGDRLAAVDGKTRRQDVEYRPVQLGRQAIQVRVDTRVVRVIIRNDRPSGRQYLQRRLGARPNVTVAVAPVDEDEVNYGLSVAAHLRARGLPVALLGKPMEFWERMPASSAVRTVG
jgi:hypothetical protein